MNAPLYLIRHTQVAVDHGICYGQLDVGLAESFEAEARAINEKIKNMSFTSTFCSPLQRCALLAQALNMEAYSDPRLMEMHFGHWEGKPWDDIYASEEGKRWFKDYWTTPCPGGESYQDLMDRVRAFLQELSRSSGPHPSQPCCLVTHAGVIRAMLILLCGVDPVSIFDIKVAYGHIISIDNGRFTFL